MKKLSSRNWFSFSRHKKCKFADGVKITLPKSNNFPLNDWKTFVDDYASKTTYNSPQQNHLDAVMHPSRFCRNFSTKLNEVPLQLLRGFCIRIVSGIKCRGSPSASVENSCDNRTDIFPSKFHFSPKSWKRLARNLKENTELLKFFSEKVQSSWKSSSRQTKRIFDNRLEIHQQSTTIFRSRSEKNS